MKILKKGQSKEWSFKRTCGGCNSVLEHTLNDIQSDRDGYYIICPVCNKFLTTSNPIYNSRNKEC